jgi:two-component system, LytTR family, response regulator
MVGQKTSALPRPGPLRLLIVDKEPAARCAFTRLCDQIADLHIVGEADSGGAAIAAVEDLAPDVMLIDLALPDMTGFDVLRLAGNSMRPLGITTSHEPEYAERAIAEGAVDHLLKPVSADRFDHAIGRVRQRCGFGQATERRLIGQILRLLERRPKLLVGERQRRLYPLDVEKIDYVEADGNYVTIRVGDTEYISRDSIKRLAADLADFGFVRIDRSILLNIRAVQFAEPTGHGTLAFTLSSGACLHSSKTYRETIVRLLPWHHCRAGSNV